MNSYLSILAAVLISVESEGNTKANGANSEAGCLQITPVLVQDVNRFAKTHYQLANRYDKDDSLAMFFLYSRHYATYERLNREPTPEDVARMWNGGPNGHKRKATKVYWKKVRSELHRRGYDARCKPYRR